MIKQLQIITAPFAYSSAHVQGPGGNTSFKQDGDILIKGSGFTFSDVVHSNGVVKLNNRFIADNLHEKHQHLNNQIESATPEVLESVPAGIKPSMEYEFHSLLNTYVVHTHSVYANVISCSAECSKLLSEIFTASEYLLIPYVTPGYPIAAALLAQGDKNWPPIIFLKNHGIIVHGHTAEEVLERYEYAESAIKNHLGLKDMQEVTHHRQTPNICTLQAQDISGMDLERMEDELTQKVLIPDQSIFFRNKISSINKEADIFIDLPQKQLIIKGSEKFIAAAVGMLQAVYYIKSNMAALALQADFIGQEYLDILHGLSTEKYRLSLLKK